MAFLGDIADITIKGVLRYVSCTTGCYILGSMVRRMQLSWSSSSDMSEH